MSGNRAMREVIRSLRRHGFTVTTTKGNHIRIERPDMSGPVFYGSTPSDRRGLKNLYGHIRRKLDSPGRAKGKGETENACDCQSRGPGGTHPAQAEGTLMIKAEDRTRRGNLP